METWLVIGDVWSWLAARPPCLLAIWYVLMSLLTFVLYWHDKRAAIAGKWRTPEDTLHLFELLGGWPGAWVAQKILRHKCSKASYQGMFWTIVVLNLLFLVYLTYGWLSGDWHLDLLREKFGLNNPPAVSRGLPHLN